MIVHEDLIAKEQVERRWILFWAVLATLVIMMLSLFFRLYEIASHSFEKIEGRVTVLENSKDDPDPQAIRIMEYLKEARNERKKADQMLQQDAKRSTDYSRFAASKHGSRSNGDGD